MQSQELQVIFLPWALFLLPQFLLITKVEPKRKMYSIVSEIIAEQMTSGPAVQLLALFK